MLYYSTNKIAPKVTLETAITRGIAPDGGLYMPDSLTVIPSAFFKNIDEMSLPEIAYIVASILFRDEMNAEEIKNIVFDSLNFDIPLVNIRDNIFSLELNHGPSRSFKDVGTRFMARLMEHYLSRGTVATPVNLLIATSGDTGLATINAFSNITGVNIHILTPRMSGSLSKEDLMELAAENVHVIEVNGNYDACYSIIKQALREPELSHLNLTTANTINIGAFLPQTFYYFYAYAQLLAKGVDCNNLVFAVPSGNIGNLVSGLIAKKTGLPVKRFIAINNTNDVFTDYLKTGVFHPRNAVPTMATTLDVGDPSNFARISTLFNGSHSEITDTVTGAKFSDVEISQAIKELYQTTGYIATPCGASGYKALTLNLGAGETGIFLETSHPAKFASSIEPIIGKVIYDSHKNLSPRSGSGNKIIKIPPTLSALKKYLLTL